jgi:hypothetical protein
LPPPPLIFELGAETFKFAPAWGREWDILRIFDIFDFFDF